MDYKVSENKSAFKIYNKKYKKKMNTNKLTLRGLRQDVTSCVKRSS